jgi:hypothetical protein
MTDHKDEDKLALHMGIPNGVILTLIGILVLITPLVKAIPDDKLMMNWIAGGVLTLGGIASFIFGLKRSGRAT